MLKKLVFSRFLPFNRKKNSNFAPEIHKRETVTSKSETVTLKKRVVRMRMTPAVKVILIINVVLYVMAYWITPMVPMDGHPDWFLNANALHPLGGEGFAIYQYLTYMFMHGGWWHLFFNMWSLMIFGNAVEQQVGTKRFWLYYLLCGIGAALVNQCMTWVGLINPAQLVGASGAIYGVMGAAAFFFPNAKLFIIPIPFPIKAIYFVFFYIALEVIEFLSIKDGIAHLAHLGGMLFGWLLMLYWKHNKSKDINNWKQTKSHSGGSTSKNGNIFGWGTKQTTHSASSQDTSYSTTAGPSAPHQDAYADNARKKEAARVIDEILDKIRKDGWDSLSKEEQQKIIDASKEI